MKLRKDGTPDRRTTEGRAYYKRSEAARRGWETRREASKEAARIERERFERRSESAKKGWETRRFRTAEESYQDEIIVEEPIETVGGPRRRSGRRRK